MATSLTPEIVGNIYDAYASGKMSPQQAKEFEDDVSSGAIMLPVGAKLKGQQPVGTVQPVMLPKEVTQAYVSGKMSPKQKADLEADVKAGIVMMPPDVGELIPKGPGWQQPTSQPLQAPAAPEPSIGQKIVGAGEAGLTAATGATSGLAGLIGGTGYGLAQAILSGQFGTPQAANLVEQYASKGAEALTYAPRTETGQEYAATVGKASQELLPLMGMAPQLQSLGLAAEAAGPITSATAQRGLAATRQGVQQAADLTRRGATAVGEFGGRVVDTGRGWAGLEPRAVAAGTERGGLGGSIGAAATPEAQQRVATATNLPVGVRLTTGEATRSAEQLQFEKEQLKNPELGGPLRTLKEEQNVSLLHNFDALYDMTDARLSEVGPAAVGDFVVRQLASGLAAAKNRVRAAYKAAEMAGEMSDLVSLPEVIRRINETAPESDLAPIIAAVRKKALAVGAAVEGENGELIAQPVSLLQAENLRKTMANGGLSADPTNQFHASQFKNIFDAETEGLGGDLYKTARALRVEQANKYENRAVVARLIKNRKNMADPQVAADMVFNKSILTASPDEISFLKQIVMQASEDGPQAWKELQGAAIRHIQDVATKSMQMDSSGNPLVSTAKLHEAVRSLDANGRLDIVFGKQQAQIIRDLADVARYINTVPPGTLINNSGTAMTVLQALTEAAGVGMLTGVSIPVLTALKELRKVVQNNRIKAKIDASVRGLQQ